MENNLTNSNGLAHALKISRDWLITEAKEGRIPFLKAGKKRLFNVDAVRDVLAQRAANPKELSHAKN